MTYINMCVYNFVFSCTCWNPNFPPLPILQPPTHHNQFSICLSSEMPILISLNLGNYQFTKQKSTNLCFKCNLYVQMKTCFQDKLNCC